MAEVGSPLVKSTTKWQVALAVGLPVAVGVGYWYLINKLKGEKPIKLEGKNKSKSREISIDGNISAKVKEDTAKKTPLELATQYKEEGNKWFKSSKYNEAIASYEKAIEICPKNETINLATFYQNKAAAYEQLQKYQEVKEACAKALSFNPKYTKALLRRAKVCELTNDLTQALEDVIAACIFENFQSQSTVSAADRILKQLGHQHAKEALAKRIPIIPSISFIKNYFQSFVNDPLNPFLLKTEGDTSKGFLKAVDCFKREEYGSIIAACTEEINLTEAEALYKNEALVLRATFYLLTGENNLALPDLDIVIHNEEASSRLRANALIKRASYHMQQDDLFNCIKDFNSAVAIDEHNSDIYHHRGQVKLLLDKVNEAADDFKMAVALNPNNPITLIHKCYTEYRLGLLTQNVDSPNKMLQRFEEIIKDYPDCTECYLLYAQVLTDLEEFEKAADLFQRVLKVDPKNAVSYVRQAMFILQWKGDAETAINYINKALELDEKCEFAYETLGTIEAQRGNITRAIELFDKAIPLTKTELEMTHIFSLRNAAMAQKTVAEKMNIQGINEMNIPGNMFIS